MVNHPMIDKITKGWKRIILKTVSPEDLELKIKEYTNKYPGKCYYNLSVTDPRHKAYIWLHPDAYNQLLGK